MHCTPFELAAVSTFPTRSTWDAAAADLVRTMLERWSLTPGAPLVGGEASSVISVTTPDGQSAILKVGYPHPEAVWEAVALEAFGPDTAPRVLRQDPWTWSLLLEHLSPGTDLARSDLPVMEKLGQAMTVLRTIAATPVPQGIPELREVVGEQLGRLRGSLAVLRSRLDDLGVLGAVESGLAEAEGLAATDRRRAFLHGDFNPHNLVRGEHGWRAIDPKPLRGDLEYDVWPLVSQLHSSVPLLHRVEATGVDTRRAARWGVARSAFSIVWALEDRTPTEPAVRELREWMNLLSAL